ncbi:MULTISPECIES: CaiB/BaiF CoA-transferase family protein [unclassified Rhizobium]|uniref:CaiB/BaiF CoA transferase family protein n=1 Tax=unclassified Rhizobium TaxID=2613769 RepID=UPI000DDEFB33|nr:MULTISPECIES: CaiB/BaiF CoA-transferase family protein [unclassified Rhizobium]MBB3285841.1 crotonobetainyl-CoA:carnitine CoA-transferase CaiB-like acyl-CoA transferase [Rhizobium sp. BK252]MBB3400997.1 crotonobetainyl-CoA:carnitine CoA-transferase CaiB-like acyl-CoA transferase [Rhizobium sp. BK289]MBB3413159.1 crotonobetainyl-CoA:carnitine CoA-transferase CaiB-like acyl-CoA transferase [Rhizobium sp. BK284]MBB3481463.1 crotonobetainyl-CoA:carnitine CoA-transferase CaiB-like acyl-CoA transf
MTEHKTKKPPLSGIRVIELARVLAGPWAGQMLADLGADVIKVENPDGGDDTRQWGPPFVQGKDGENLSAAYYHSTNRGKRSVIADLKTEEGQELVRRLVKTADVVIENFKLGGLVKYGLDYESLKKINPRIVYCSITGFGQAGPYASLAGYDYIVQGMSGFMSITGEPDGQPMKAGVAIADIFTGIYAVSAIEAALIHALKTGAGQLIDMALLDVQSAVLANQNMNYLISGKPPVRLGNAHPNISPYEVVPTADGYLILAVGNDGQFRRLCTILGVETNADDERYATNKARVANRNEVRAFVSAETLKWNKADLLRACETNAVPAGAINTIEDMFADPQIVARGLRIDLEDSAGTVIPSVRTPIVLSETPLTYTRPSPRLGEHQEEVLAELAELEGKAGT